MIAKKKISTPTAFAKLLARGIQANFNPKCRKKASRKLADLFREMATARDIDAELGGRSGFQYVTKEARLAASDVAWLEEIADALDK